MQATVRLCRAKPIPGLEDRETWGTRKAPQVRGRAWLQPCRQNSVSIHAPQGCPRRFPNWEVYCLVPVPPPPFILQNLEKTRVILPLCARSLSLKELRAKSREHWSYGGRDVPLWNKRTSLGRGSRSCAAWVRLSKIDDYLVDNVCCSRLSDLEVVVNDKTPRGIEGSSECAEMRDRDCSDF